MITQIKKWGHSSTIVLSKEFMKFYNLKDGDFIDASDIKKAEKDERDDE